jgi:aquaporin Z
MVTAPGPWGVGIAFLAEFTISLLMMSTILWTSNSRRWSRFTPIFAAALVAVFIAVEAPLSGMSMNPARTLASAYSAEEWNSLWIYFTAPPLSMMLASVLYRSQRGTHAVFCAKLHHANQQRCIFNCRYEDRFRRE